MTTLVLPGKIATELLGAASKAHESAAVLLARPLTTPNGDLRILACSLEWVADDAYTRRTAHELLITSEGYVHALGKAQQGKYVAIFLHTHPGSSNVPEPSYRDSVVDQQLTNLFHDRTDVDFYGSLVISRQVEDLMITGNITYRGEQSQVNRIFIVGERLSLLPAYGQSYSILPDRFDRNIRAFGGEIQQVLQNLHVGIVGCGGTGSAVAEQLVRLGVQQLTLMDPDRLSTSNVTRVYGSTLDDVGELKVDVLGANLTKIIPDVHISKIPTMITNQSSAKRLASCDVIFGCTDDNAGRLILSRLATYLIVPVIDCGVILSSDATGLLTGIDGRVTVLVPGAACLTCRDRIDITRANSELMTPEEHGRLAGEGYAPALNGIEPAVITYTSSVAAMAVSELLERLIHYGIEPVPNEIILRMHDREMSSNIMSPKTGHYCDPQSGKLGLGVSDPFLDFQWTS